MKYIKIEQEKLKKSRIYQWCLAMVIVYLIAMFAVFLMVYDKLDIFKLIFKVLAGLNYLPLVIPGAAFSALLFAKEIEENTMTYVVIRPVQKKWLVLSKICASMIYYIKMIGISIIVTLIVGFIFCDIRQFAFDKSIIDSILRCIIYVNHIITICLFYCIVSAIISVLVKNTVFSCAISVILLTISNYITIKIEILGKVIRFPITTFYSPAEYYDIEISQYLVRSFKYYGLNIIVLVVTIMILFFALNKKGIFKTK
ncbi:ABC transporter permease [Cellulosilyticum ruminicola]|uniref:ABC transporter permease n=1 Tax=Cellulosilyticum ruminicola TaxID=425254 RepID=UPI00155DB404|nr:ABC transporter permease [Cellulosilyticum ruminicola]